MPHLTLSTTSKKTLLLPSTCLSLYFHVFLLQVLTGFLRLDTPLEELPLLIDFEAKSIAKKFPLAKERMEQL